MRKTLHKLIRLRRPAVNLIADVNAVVSTGEPGVVNASRVRSRNRIVQRSGQTWTESETVDMNEKEDRHDQEP
ncbi:MAG: hypothetical protein E6I99_14310 [Chloroflexi bacterium]|nr:MAG: hypothetical protein E6I99_14310 [Chloroflexota bacterium]TMD83553.1 MAG: hypothetical protein E6I74_04965 [Chloroflexota bacterium]